MKKNILPVFANMTRLKVINCLTDRPKNVGQLMKICRLSQSAVSQHLSKLKNAGLVQSDKIGKEVYYRLDNNRVGAITRILLNFVREEERR